MESSIIQLALADLPSDTVPKELYDDFLNLHRAIKSLALGVSRYAGIDAPSSDIWSSLAYSDTLLMANHTRMYPTADIAITAGQMVNLYNNAGNLRARLADATLPATFACGVAMTSAAIGEQFEMYWLRGLVNTIGGMTVGTLYWLSTVPGSIQNIAPAVPGQIQQPVGVALTSSQLLMDIPLSYRIV